MTRDAYIGDYGTQVILNTGEDLTQATINTVSILVKKPSGSFITWVGSVLETTKILYELKEGDLDETGTWIIQAIVDASIWKGKGRTSSFRVKRLAQS